MAQVVRPQGFIGPLVILVVGIVLLFNGVPALIQWLSWIAQSALVIGVEGAMDQAIVPLLLAGLSTFVGFLMLRGGWGSLMKLARSASSRAREQARTGVQQVRREVDQRYSQVSSQAEHLQNRVPQSWRDRIEAAAQEVEQERARRSGQQPQVHSAQQHAVQQPRPQGQQRPPQPQQQRPQQQRPPQVAPAQAPQQPRQPQAPGADRLQRIEDLRQRTGERARQLLGDDLDVRQAAQELRRASQRAARQAQQTAGAALPMHFDESTQALLGRLDAEEAQRVHHRGSTLTRSSLRASSLAKTSLSLNSLRQSHR
jgi:pyruvate/2-oxoglutarate dehydrogenase complex dihydrolipoamide acyltransferase (E2) component